MSNVEYRDTEGDIVWETNDIIFDSHRIGRKITIKGIKYEIIESFIITEKRSYWWSFGFQFEAPKLVVYVEPLS